MTTTLDEERPRWGNLVAATLALTADGFDLAIMAYLLPYVQKEFGVSLGVASFLLLATTVTRWVGALLFGSLATRFGRKPILIAAVATCGVFTLGSGLAPAYGALLVIRLLFGLGVGGVYASAGALIRESAGRRGGLFAGVMIFGWFGGGALSPIVYRLVLPTTGWRGVFIAEGLILLIIPYLVLGMKESPVWLADRARRLERRAAVGLGAGQGGAAGLRPEAKPRSFWYLFAPGFLGTTLMLLLLEYGNFFAQSSSSLLPTYLDSIHLDIGQIAVIGTISGFIGMPGSLIGGWLCDRIGRKRTFRLLFGLIWIPVVLTFTVHSFTVIVIAWAVYGLINGALGGALAVFETEQYPTDLRSPGYGFAHNVGTLGGAFGTTFAAFLAARISLPAALIGLTLLGVVLGILAMVFARETAGRSLLTGDVVDEEEAARAGEIGDAGAEGPPPQYDHATTSHRQER